MGNRNNFHSGIALAEDYKIRETFECGSPDGMMENREPIRVLLDALYYLSEFLDEPLCCSPTSLLIPVDRRLGLSKRGGMNTGWLAVQRWSRDCNRRWASGHEINSKALSSISLRRC